MVESRIRCLRGFWWLALTGIAALAIAGCPARKPAGTQEAYHIGSWAGKVTTNALLVRKLDKDYWNAAWRVEADIRLDEYDNGTLKGTAMADFFIWDTHDSIMHQLADIQSKPWTKFASFKMDLTGTITDKGYELKVVELPMSLPDPAKPGSIIEFWDFLYPSVIQGEWPPDGMRVMQGDSIRPQGKDLEATMALEDYRDSEVDYSWSIRKL